MKYALKYSDAAKEDMRKLRKSGDKQAVKKLDKLLVELENHPTFGTGHPEQLRHRRGNIWSRHITEKHRLVYEIFDDFIMVEVQQTYGHYDDK